MTRQQLIEQIIRNVEGGYQSDDSNITPGLVNLYINQGIAAAVKANYADSLKIDGVGYVNGSFYTTFKGLDVVADENFLWKIELPETPLGIGRNEGIANLVFKSSQNEISRNAIPISLSQKGYYDNMRPIPNKVLYYYEGDKIYAKSVVLLSEYKASVTMISGGAENDVNSPLNVPMDMIPMVMEYCIKMLSVERKQPKDLANDGEPIT